MLNDQTIFQQIERVAQLCPWDRVDVWVTRIPEGTFRFTVYINSTIPEFKVGSIFGHGDTPEAAADDALKQAGEDRDPNRIRLLEIQKLRLQIAKLETMNFGLPPYQPPRQIGEPAPAAAQRPPPAPSHINV